MPPKKDADDAGSRKRGSAEVDLDAGGDRRKGARTEATSSAAPVGTRTKGLRVKLTGAGTCSRRDPAALPEETAEESGAAPAATESAPAAEPAAAAADATPAGAKFQVGAVVILYNGSLRYEAEVIKVRLPSPRPGTNSGPSAPP